MITMDFEQGSQQWFQARCGIPTASNADKVITTTGKKSTQAGAYINTLLAEWLTGEKTSIKQSDWMARGVELEPEARSAYEFINDTQVKQVGIVYRDEQKLVACSPDGLLDNKGLEIKCPAPGTHVGYLLGEKVPSTYIPQIQFSMWVTGFEQWDFLSYHPDMPPMIITVDRDDKFITALHGLMQEFTAELIMKRVELCERLGLDESGKPLEAD